MGRPTFFDAVSQLPTILVPYRKSHLARITHLRRLKAGVSASSFPWRGHLGLLQVLHLRLHHLRRLPPRAAVVVVGDVVALERADHAHVPPPAAS